MKKYCIVQADTNDGDYITEKNLITDEQIKELTTALSKLGLEERRGLRWYTNDQVNERRGNFSPEKMYEGILTEKEIELIQEFTPYGEYGIHTIETIEILEVANEYTLL